MWISVLGLILLTYTFWGSTPNTFYSSSLCKLLDYELHQQQCRWCILDWCGSLWKKARQDTVMAVVNCLNFNLTLSSKQERNLPSNKESHLILALFPHLCNHLFISGSCAQEKTTLSGGTWPLWSLARASQTVNSPWMNIPLIFLFMANQRKWQKQMTLNKCILLARPVMCTVRSNIKLAHVSRQIHHTLNSLRL